MKGKNFNKMVANFSNKVVFKSNKDIEKSKYKTIDDYHKSFDKILKFEKKFTQSKKDKTIFDTVIFHNENNDGFISAYISWQFLVKDNNKNVTFYPTKPGHGNDIDYRVQKLNLSNKNILILDLSYNNKTIDYIKKVASSYLIIDDHSSKGKGNDNNRNNTNNANGNNPNIFISNNHAAVATVFKFFYPKLNVPKIVMYIDDSDGKLFLPFTPHSNLLAVSLGFRYVHNILKTLGPDVFNELYDSQLLEDSKINFWIFVGKYYEEVRDDLKDQIARNAQIRTFQGYKVGVLNFNAPSLAKPVGRQIISNFNKSSHVIDFAILWGYEYVNNAYRIQLIDDHKQNKINMKSIAEKLAKIGGSPKGGGGHTHVGNFYWPKDKDHDIWDLFTKQLL